MSNLVQHKIRNINFVLDTETGDSFLTVYSYSKLIKKYQRAICVRVAKLPAGTIQRKKVFCHKNVKTLSLIPHTIYEDWIEKDLKNGRFDRQS
jgi:hypothetical protein